MRPPNIYYNYSPVSLHLLKVGGQNILAPPFYWMKRCSPPPHQRITEKHRCWNIIAQNIPHILYMPELTRVALIRSLD